jgi:hypothetical protein
MRVILIGIAVLAAFTVTNLVYQILHKPTEVFALIPGESNKAPVETWTQYASLFREYSTTSISPELLAALAQVESAGNPIARTWPANRSDVVEAIAVCERSIALANAARPRWPTRPGGRSIRR